MKLFSSKKKIAIVGAMLTTMLAGTIAYAVTPVKQDAYYDTFKLMANGTDVMRFIGFISPSGLQAVKLLQLGELPAIFILR